MCGCPFHARDDDVTRPAQGANFTVVPLDPGRPASAARTRFSETGTGVPSCCANRLTRSSSSIQRTSASAASRAGSGGRRRRRAGRVVARCSRSWTRHASSASRCGFSAAFSSRCRAARRYRARCGSRSAPASRDEAVVDQPRRPARGRPGACRAAARLVAPRTVGVELARRGEHGDDVGDDPVHRVLQAVADRCRAAPRTRRRRGRRRGVGRARCSRAGVDRGELHVRDQRLGAPVRARGERQRLRAAPPRRHARGRAGRRRAAAAGAARGGARPAWRARVGEHPQPRPVPRPAPRPAPGTRARRMPPAPVVSTAREQPSGRSAGQVRQAGPLGDRWRRVDASGAGRGRAACRPCRARPAPADAGAPATAVRGSPAARPAPCAGRSPPARAGLPHRVAHRRPHRDPHGVLRAGGEPALQRDEVLALVEHDRRAGRRLLDAERHAQVARAAARRPRRPPGTSTSRSARTARANASWNDGASVARAHGVVPSRRGARDPGDDAARDVRRGHELHAHRLGQRPDHRDDELLAQARAPSSRSRRAGRRSSTTSGTCTVTPSASVPGWNW